VGEFFHHTQSFYGLQNAPTDDKLVSNYAQYAFTGGIQMMSKQRQMKDTLNKALLVDTKAEFEIISNFFGQNRIFLKIAVQCFTVTLNVKK